MSCRPAVAAVASLLMAAAPLGAQVIQPPERPITGLFGGGRPPDPDRARQDLMLNVNLLGGYDDNPNPIEGGGLDAFTPREAGFTGFAETALQYYRGRKAHSFELGGRGYVNAFQGLGLSPGAGGDLRTGLTAPLGRRHQIGLAAGLRSDPFYTLGTFAPLRGDVAAGLLPDANPVNGFSVRRSLGREGSVSLTSRWTPRDTVRTDYQYGRQQLSDSIGDGRAHTASLLYTRAIGRRSGWRASYRASDAEFLEADGFVRPIRNQSAELGYQHERQLTRSRRAFVSFGGGASYVDTLSSLSRQPLDYVMPSGYANTQVDVARTWSVSADYRRAVSVLEGLTAEAFTTDAALLRVGGFLGSRSELAFSAAYSIGAGIATESPAKFDSYTGTIQLRFMLTRWWAALVSHNFYAYRLRGLSDLPAGLPSRLNRHATRVGMTFDVPLYGGYIGRRTGSGQ